MKGINESAVPIFYNIPKYKGGVSKKRKVVVKKEKVPNKVPVKYESKKKSVGRYTKKGYYGGYFGQYRKFKGVTPYRQRYARALKGVTFQWERTAEITDDRCIYVTHHDLPYLTLLKASVYALLKKFLLKMNVDFSSWTDVLTTAFVPDGTTFSVEWRQSYNVSTSVASCVKVAADTTFKALADRIFADIFVTQFLDASGIGFDSPAQLISMETNIASRVTRMNLIGARLDVMTRSALKMQNRSVPLTGDDQSDNVNNVPLEGKSYQGTGNGFIGRDNATVIPPADGVWAWSSSGAGATAILQEPPEPYHFKYVNKVTKVKLPSGALNTSVLNGKLNMEFDRFLRYCRFIRRSNGGTTALGYTNMGHCRMFALERSIARLTTELQPGISIAAEIDFKMYLDISLKASAYTAPDNVVL